VVHVYIRLYFMLWELPWEPRPPLIGAFDQTTVAQR